jgi:protein required for attachment to host cells
MHGKKWILVADASRARLLQWETEHFLEIADFTHPEGHLRNQDLVSDQPGRKGAGFDRPGLDYGKSPKEVELERFALRLADILKHGLDHQLYEELLLVCPPHFLGCLRKVLDKQVLHTITVALDRDFTDLNRADLVERLRHCALV